MAQLPEILNVGKSNEFYGDIQQRQLDVAASVVKTLEALDKHFKNVFSSEYVVLNPTPDQDTLDRAITAGAHFEEQWRRDLRAEAEANVRGALN